MAAIRVGVMRGGPSSEYEVSLATGGSVICHLPEPYRGRDILIAKDGEWHLDGVPAQPEQIVKQVDVVFNALHGEYGEDGTVQRLLDQLGALYTGSGALASALGMNKPLAKEYFQQAGLLVPFSVVVSTTDDPAATAQFVFNKFSPPWVVKPTNLGSSIGVAVVKKIVDLPAALAAARAFGDRVLVEQFIRGREATCGVVEGWRGHDLYPLFPIEIRRPAGSDFWDYQAKYSGETEEICPGYFTAAEKHELQTAAVRAHQALGLRHYSRADFIVSPRGIYILEINTLPGLTKESLLPKAIAAAGSSYPEFIDHLIRLALAHQS